MLLKAAREQLGIPGVVGLSPDNPAAEPFHKHCYVIPGGSTATSLGKDMPKLAPWPTS
jgi:hypothetical protein